MKTCANCNALLKGRVDAKYCSPRCRIDAFRKGGANLQQEQVAVDVNFQKPAWVTEIENYCMGVNIEPADLIKCHQNIKKDLSLRDIMSSEKEETKAATESFFEKRQRESLK